MKILHISTYTQFCGIGNYARSLVKNLDALGHDNRVFVIQPEIMADCQSIEAAKAYYQQALEMAKEVDAVHIQHEFSFFKGAYFKNDSLYLFAWLLDELEKLPVKVLVTFHSPIFFLSKPWKFTINRIWRQHVGRHFTPKGKATALVHNEFTRREYQRSGFHKNNLVKIPHPPEALAPQLEESKALTAQLREALHCQEGDTVLAILGFINSVKGHFMMLDVLKELPSSYKLLVLGGTPPKGDPKMENRLRETVRKAGLEDRVHITGLFEENKVVAMMDAADLFLAPYSRKFRSSSGAIYMALQSGKPVIASDCGSFVEINQEQPALAMFPDGNKKALQNTILRLANNPDECETRREAIRRYLHEHRPIACAEKTVALYHS